PYNKRLPALQSGKFRRALPAGEIEIPPSKQQCRDRRAAPPDRGIGVTTFQASARVALGGTPSVFAAQENHPGDVLAFQSEAGELRVALARQRVVTGRQGLALAQAVDELREETQDAE